MENKEELLPCPFCGNKPEFGYEPTEVYCTHCKYTIEDECHEAVIKAWNHRYTPPIQTSGYSTEKKENTMDLNMRLIEIGWEIERLPASEQQTKVITMLSDLREKINKQQPVSKDSLVPLDNQELRNFLTFQWSKIGLSVNQENKLADAICAKFGQKQVQVPTVEEIENIVLKVITNRKKPTIGYFDAAQAIHQLILDKQKDTGVL